MKKENIKIIILGGKNIDTLKLGKTLSNKYDELDVAPVFTSDPDYKNKTSEYKTYLSPEEITIGYKNNAFLYIVSDENYISTGVSLDDLYNNDIMCMNISEFNNISESIFSKHNFLIIWLDTKYHMPDYNINDDILETRYLLEKLDYTNYMYFLDEDYNDVADIIIEYLEADDNRKRELLEENL